VAEVDLLEDRTLGDVICPTTTEVAVNARTSTANFSIVLIEISLRFRFLPIRNDNIRPARVIRDQFKEASQLSHAEK
jgi:hypothetical protein